jgi:hypothetical protein
MLDYRLYIKKDCKEGLELADNIKRIDHRTFGNVDLVKILNLLLLEKADKKFLLYKINYAIEVANHRERDDKSEELRRVLGID